MTSTRVFVIALALAVSVVWTGCETKKDRGTNTGSSSRSPGMATMKNIPKDQLWRVQVEDFQCLANAVHWEGKNVPHPEQVAKGLSAKFENYLLNSGAFIILGSNVSGDKAMAKDKIVESTDDFHDQETAPEFGKMQAAQYVMRGQVISFDQTGGGAIAGGNEHFVVGVGATTYKVTLSCRVFEIATNRLVFAAEGYGEIEDTQLIAGGGDQNFFVGGEFASNTPVGEAVDKAVDALVCDIVDRAYR